MITSYDTLPLGTYLDILAVNGDESRDDIDKQVATIALLNGCDERTILNTPLPEYSEMAAALDFLAHPASKVGRPAARYTLGPWALIPTADLKKVTTAQYIDFQTYAAEGDRRLVEILSVMLVPEGRTYADGYDPEEVQDAIREYLSVRDALSLVAFFFERFLESTRATLNSLEREVRRTKRIRDVTKRAEMQARIQATRADLQARLRAVGDGYTKLIS